MLYFLNRWPQNQTESIMNFIQYYRGKEQQQIKPWAGGWAYKTPNEQQVVYIKIDARYIVSVPVGNSAAEPVNET